MRLALLLLLPLTTACSGDDEPVGLALLGAGSHDSTLLQIEVLATSAQGLATPTDVAVNPNKPDQLWVTNKATNSVTRLDGDDYATAWTSGGVGQEHFLVSPAGIAFADNGQFATIHDTDELTQGNMTPRDFMGPTMWDDSDRFDGAHAGHLDMLHNTPLGGGIAWEKGAVYWVFDGYHNSITRYDFVDDHGYGGADHSDGIITRYVEGEVARVDDVPSHLVVDPGTNDLLIADTANGRIAVLDMTTGTLEGRIGPNYDGGAQNSFTGGIIDTFVEETIAPVLTLDGEPSVEELALNSPSGIAVHDGLIWVTDHDTSTIAALDRSGEVVDWVALDRAPGSLGGIAFTPAGDLVVVDMVAQELLRISAPATEE